jgi:predicted ATPase
MYQHYGAGEAYLSLLDALARQCRESGGGRLLEMLDKHAPGWLVQMPGLLNTAQLKELQGRVAGATLERMLRELADAIEVISQERPLVLRLEDLHWSDYSTLEWLGFLARRPESARIMVLGTYRPVEVIVREHPLKRLKNELQLHGLCKESPLPLLSEASVMEYLNLRFASLNSSSGERRAECHPQEPVRKLAQTIYERTDGNPLFMVNVFDHLVEGKGLKSLHDRAGSPPAEALVTNSIEMPPSLARMIEHNVERLNPDEQVVLEAASVTGIEFPAAAVAAALERPVTDIEAYCSRLARQQQFIHARGVDELPDGTVTATFRFLHALYRDVLRQRVPPGRQVELHRRIADRGEQAYGDKVGDVAVELAYHYRLAGNRIKTVTYLELAAERATARRAYHDAERHYRDAIEVLRAVPESPERFRHELSLLLALGSTTAATRGISSAESTEI